MGIIVTQIDPRGLMGIIVTQIDPRGLMGIVEQRACNFKMEGSLKNKIQNKNKSALIKLHFIFPGGYLNE